MKKNRFFILVLIGIGFVFSSCNTSSPEKYFDTAVLNTNLLQGFANNGLQRELESPSVEMVQGIDVPVPMHRKEVIETKIRFVEETLKKIHSLKEDESAKSIVQNSLALYEYVLPVYKNEYSDLADMYDENASKETIQKKIKEIEEKYAPHFEELYLKLISNGKLYATQHDIKVNWAM